MIQPDETTLYDVLDLTPDASPQEIRAAYLSAKSTYSKDNPVLYTLISTEEREETLRKVEESYIILSDPERRRQYDRSHSHLSTTSRPALTNGMDEGFEPMPPPPPEPLIQHPRPANSDPQRTPVARKIPANLVLPPKSPPSPRPPGEPPPFDNPKGSLPSAPPSPPQESTSFDFFETQSPAPPSPRRPEAPLRAPEAPQKPPPANAAQILGAVLAEAIDQEREWKGSFIRKIREAYQISIEEMSDKTKISKTYILAIEEENFVKLPAAVFIRGFVTQIVRVLKLPQEKVATAYMARYQKTKASS